jgi:hypothetical protein
MNKELLESLDKAEHAMTLAVNKIREAHSKAADANPVASLVVFDLIAPARQIRERLKELQSVLS